jgi:hypothetical protein
MHNTVPPDSPSEFAIVYFASGRHRIFQPTSTVEGFGIGEKGLKQSAYRKEFCTETTGDYRRDGAPITPCGHGQQQFLFPASKIENIQECR